MSSSIFRRRLSLTDRLYSEKSDRIIRNVKSVGGWLGAISLAAGIALCPQQSAAEGFTGSDFAEWPQASQNGYIQTSVTMAGVVMTQIRPEFSRCIDQWYLGDGRKEERNRFIRETITGHAASYHPAGTILAILMDQCGSLP